MSPFWLIVLSLIYFLFPFDILPDFLPGVGRIDDLIVLLYAFWSATRKKRGYAPTGQTGSTGTDSRTDYRRQEYRKQESAGSARNTSWTRAKDPYRILGVAPAASLDEVKQAYRTQANRYHPDKVTHLGQEFQALAQEKFREVQWAYEAILRERKKDETND